jgi:rsbT co-antagonist protein RsbR
VTITPVQDDLAEVTALRRRVAELELELSNHQHRDIMLAQYQHIAIEAARDGIAILDSQGTYIYMNNAHAHIHGYSEPSELLGKSWKVVVPADMIPVFETKYMPVLFQEGYWRGEVPSQRKDGSLHPTEIALTVLDGGGMVCVLRDITDQKQSELERARLQEEIIQAQAAALAELSTPLIPINEQVMVMPLIGSIDSRRIQQVLDTLLSGVAASHASVVILDITGVPVVDTQVANALVRAAQSVKLLGASVVLTGIRPEVAQTLIGLGANLSNITTRGTLQSGIAYATGK